MFFSCLFHETLQNAVKKLWRISASIKDAAAGARYVPAKHLCNARGASSSHSGLPFPLSPPPLAQQILIFSFRCPFVLLCLVAVPALAGARKETETEWRLRVCECVLECVYLCVCAWVCVLLCVLVCVSLSLYLLLWWALLIILAVHRCYFCCRCRRTATCKTGVPQCPPPPLLPPPLCHTLWRD